MFGFSAAGATAGNPIAKSSKGRQIRMKSLRAGKTGSGHDRRIYRSYPPVGSRANR